MEIGSFDKFITMNRGSFRFILDKNLDKVYNEDGELIDFKDWIINVCFDGCSSEFEEQTMAENLREEFEDFIKAQGE